MQDHSCCDTNSTPKPQKPSHQEGNDSHDHDKHAGHNPDMFKKKFWLSLLLSLIVVAYSPFIMEWLGYNLPMFTGSTLISPVIGTFIFFYGGLVFLKSARSEIKNRQPGMMTLISLAITVAFAYSLAVSLNLLAGVDFWWELATLITIMLLGHWLEMASVMNAQGALQELAKLLPDEAEVLTNAGTKTIPISELRVGDKVLVRPGSNVPVDGTVTKGQSDVNEAMLTGESKPVKKDIGSGVIAGTVNDSGSLTIKVTKLGDDTALAGIMKLVSEAQSSKSKTQVLADKAAFYLTFVALGAALLTAMGWGVFSDQSGAFVIQRVVTVLIIACPHALGLAIPLVTAISTTKAANSGLLIRERLALESARNLDVVLFDKTGTLTTGKQGVIDVITKEDETALLTTAAAVENESEHPIARAIVTYAKDKNIQIKAAKNFKALAGRGAQASIAGKTVHVGGSQLLTKQSVTIPDYLKEAAATAAKNGKTVVYVLRDNKVIGAITLADVIRPESKQSVADLQRAGKRVAIITGDSDGVAAWVSNELGVDEYFAEVLPQHKADVVKKLQANGDKVAMVGDGVNDAPALTQADVGIAIGAGTDVAIESAGIVLASSDPRGVTKVVTLSKATYRKMVQNLVWATGYNAVAIPLAAGVTASLGFVLSPAIGAVLMSLSTIIVAVNAQFLRRLQL
ncbi:MAG: heavy metal translocating P-type ATPase [Candidatus Saccharibacteria bacterium]|nr:heavy metal translocating P-type ATPase [Candidatus Saccharibacteria bacterium]